MSEKMPEVLQNYINASSDSMRERVERTIQFTTDYYRVEGLLLTPGERDELNPSRLLDRVEELTRLRAENERLREGWRAMILQALQGRPGYCGDHSTVTVMYNKTRLESALAALGAKHE